MPSNYEVRVPDIGEYKDVSVIEVMVKSGDTVAKDAPLIILESDKATLEVPSPMDGVVQDVQVKLGDKLSQGSLVLLLHCAAAVKEPAPLPRQPNHAGHALVAFAPAREGMSAGPMPKTHVENIQIRVPDIGDFKNVLVVEIFVNDGDFVKKDALLVAIGSDKTMMEVPSPASGIVRKLQIKLGDKVSQGSQLLLLACEQGESLVPSVQSPPLSILAGPHFEQGRAMANVEPELPSREAYISSSPENAVPVRASPALRKLARELGVVLAHVTPSGRGGRLTREDLDGFVKRELAGIAAVLQGTNASGAGGLNLLPWPQLDFSKFGAVEHKPLSRIKKMSGANLHRNWVMIPHVTNHDDADITNLEAFRIELNREHEQIGVKVSPLAFVVKVSVAALKAFPEFNASLVGDMLALKYYYHIGFAANTPNGLVVPVIRDADRKGVVDIAKEMAALSAKARAGKLTSADMQGGSFSISSLGGIGGSYFTPIINAPEVAILGVGKAQTRVVWVGGKPEPRLYLPLSLSWDHRVVDGSAAGRFNTYLVKTLGDLRRLLL